MPSLSLASPGESDTRTGGVNVHAWVFRPPNFDPRRKYPALLEIHGGPHTQVGHGFYHEKQWMAARGYIVVSGNPRGSVGYGLRFANCIHADWGNKIPTAGIEAHSGSSRQTAITVISSATSQKYRKFAGP